MEPIFAALGHPLRLWVVLYLIAHGPSRQAAILAALNDENVAQRTLNAGEMTYLLRPLFAAKLLNRATARGPVHLTEPDQTARLLTVASALAVATTEAAGEEAQRAHAQLMRRIAEDVSGWSQLGQD